VNPKATPILVTILATTKKFVAKKVKTLTTTNSSQQ